MGQYYAIFDLLMKITHSFINQGQLKLVYVLGLNNIYKIHYNSGKKLCLLKDKSLIKFELNINFLVNEKWGKTTLL